MNDTSGLNTSGFLREVRTLHNRLRELDVFAPLDGEEATWRQGREVDYSLVIGRSASEYLDEMTHLVWRLAAVRNRTRETGMLRPEDALELTQLDHESEEAWLRFMFGKANTPDTHLVFSVADRFGHELRRAQRILGRASF